MQFLWLSGLSPDSVIRSIAEACSGEHSLLPPLSLPNPDHARTRARRRGPLRNLDGSNRAAPRRSSMGRPSTVINIII